MMGGRSYTNPNRPYNRWWWFWINLFGSKRLACLLVGGHVDWVHAPTETSETCVRCGAKLWTRAN